MMSYGISGVGQFKVPTLYKQRQDWRMALRVHGRTTETFSIQSQHKDRKVAQKIWLEKALDIKDPPDFLRTAMDMLRPYIVSDVEMSAVKCPPGK